MTLFAVERSEQDGGPLVIEAATAEAADGWWAFRNDDGRTLKTLPTGSCARHRNRSVPKTLARPHQRPQTFRLGPSSLRSPPRCMTRPSRVCPTIGKRRPSPSRLGLRCSCVNELPSVALTMRFLALCDQYGSQHLAVKLVASGRNTGVPGLPETDDWTAWDADQMRAAIEHLEHKRGV